MNLRAIFTSSFFLKNIFAVSLVLLIFISSVSYKHTLTLTDSAELVTHSYEVRIELEQLVSYLTDAESGQRGFLLSRDSIFLHSLKTSRENTDKSFNVLVALTTDNLQQRNNLDSLHTLINFRFDYFYNSLDLIADEDPMKRVQLNRSLREGKKIMDLIDSLINNMIKLEMVYLKERQNKYENEISFTPIFTLLLFFFSLIVFVFAYFKINEDLFNFKKANEKLIITTESFKHAEEIGNFSSWQWDLESSILTYSDNQYRLLGCEPQSFKPSIKKFLEFVHPSDIHLIIQGNEGAEENQISTSLFRIIRKDGQLRYFKSIGKLLVDSKGKKTLIGINMDVTEQHLSNVSLEERNRDLELSNKELASFNHVASHDLQEPLRKIQTFISRISEKEATNLSDTGKEYFSKIHTSASRMRKLIDDLLLFSSTNKTEKVFDKTDLNLLLENAQQELAQIIEDKNAVIKTSSLPTLSVIPFQIQQLFINLIGNSLKYSKPDLAPVIQITCEKVLAREYPVIKADNNRKYYKISFVDNGWGFEQQYAENIFILFHRLHHITEYPGTGIGLAICKKIVENHAGVIIAEGNPGIGATFTIFLPE